MKYFFVINPHSGKKKSQRKLAEDIKAAAQKNRIQYEIYYTKAAKDGERYIREICSKYAGTGESLRIYACGGDGTVNEAVNGAFGFDNVEIGAIPLGTGNDYIRNYGDASDFLDVEAQLAGNSQYSDLIRYEGEYNGQITKGYCANMFNIGFDCNVVDMTARVKKWPLIGGSFAYLLSIIIMLIEKKGADLSILYPDGTQAGGKILLLAIANGCFCGGGIKGAPYCELDDGLMDVSVINNVTRRFFLRLFPSYAKGTHMEKLSDKHKDVIKYSKESRLTVTANGENLRLCTDGEITTQKKIEFSMVQNAFKFIVPKR